MKFRRDFVTNSSSSSFVVARKGKFSEKQKKAFLRHVESLMLGEVLLEPGAGNEEIEKAIEDNCYDYCKKEILEALKKGETVYHGSVSFEPDSYGIADFLNELWEAAEENGSFTAIDTDLSY